MSNLPKTERNDKPRELSVLFLVVLALMLILFFMPMEWLQGGAK
jgi:hypothetical protein